MPFVAHAGKNILFVHIPRTGGTSVEHWLREFGALRLFSGSTPDFSEVTPQHLRTSDIDELLGEDFFDYAFAIVRNPFDRLASEYRARRALALESFWESAPRFPTWLEKSLDGARKNPFYLDNHLRPQWEFIAKRVKIFHFEDGLKTIIARVAADIGVSPPAEVAHKLGTGKTPGDVRFDIADTERVLQAYGRDLELFGYPRTPPE